MLTLIKNSIEYSLDDGSIAYFLGDEGWGMIPLHRLSEHGPLQHGDTDRGYRGEARYGKLLFEIVEDTDTALAYKQEELMSLFHPDDNMQLRWDLPAVLEAVGQDIVILFPAYSRQFDVVYAGDMDFPREAKKGFSRRFVVTLKAPDPTCYKPTRKMVVFGGGGGSGFAVPILVPMTFGFSTMNITQDVDNAGNIDEYPEITIVGPITNPVIANSTYGEKLDFTGTTIAGGVTYVIDARYGYKTVIELPSTNRLDKLTDDSDLSTWRLRKGDNDVKVTGTGTTSATLVQIRYYDRYLGR